MMLVHTFYCTLLLDVLKQIAARGNEYDKFHVFILTCLEQKQSALSYQHRNMLQMFSLMIIIYTKKKCFSSLGKNWEHLE